MAVSGWLFPFKGYHISIHLFPPTPCGGVSDDELCKNDLLSCFMLRGGGKERGREVGGRGWGGKGRGETVPRAESCSPNVV